MKKLPVDLVTINTNSVEAGIKALEYSQKTIKFNNTYLFSSENVSGDFELIKINKFKNVIEYNNFIIKLTDYIDSEFVLIVQPDGYLINPLKWSDNFLNYDYIGAPWPSDKKWLNRWSKYPSNIKNPIHKNIEFNRIGNGGFSLRSKKFLEYSSNFESNFIKNGVPEDIFLNLVNFDLAKENNIKYPDIETAINFSYETPLKGLWKNKEKKFHYFNRKKHLGWHGNKFLNSTNLLNLKNKY
tara:strand:- start:106 stop:828 length:723 start_codon:yes stop_codon:yes gene_type:complete